MTPGSVFKKCGCRVPVLAADGSPVLDAAGKSKLSRIGSTCPKLRRGSEWNPSHRSWHFQTGFQAPGVGWQVIARGGIDNRPEAEAQLTAVRNLLGIADRVAVNVEAAGRLKLDIAARIRRDIADTRRLPDYDTVRRAIAARQPLADRTTVEQWLTSWLADKADLAPGTRRVYACHLRQYLIPHLGSIPLEGLRVEHLQRMFAAIAAEAKQARADYTARHRTEKRTKEEWRANDKATWREAKAELAAMPPYRRPCGDATRARIRATLRSALSAACAQQLIVVNVAALVHLPSGRPPRARVWTAERVACWRATGELPSLVIVRTPAQTAVFLERAAKHPQFALFHLLAFTGMRWGEAVGLRWVDVNLPCRLVTVAQQVIQLGWETMVTAPKSESSQRTVRLSDPVAAELTARRRQQKADKLAAGAGWTDTGLVFTGSEGTGLHPAWVTDQFHLLAREAGLPPIRLHDLWHGAASIALAAGVDVKVVSEMLGHSGTAITQDIYTSVYPELKRSATAAIAAAIMQARAKLPGPHGAQETAA